MAKADFITSLIFFVLGVFMVVEGIGMPGAGGFIEAGGEPGRVPVLLGGIVCFFATVLLIRSISQQGYRLFDQTAEKKDGRAGALRCALTAAGCSFYAIGLLGAQIAGWKVMYYEATGLFIFLFILGFEWQNAPELGEKRWSDLATNRPAFAGFLRSVFSVVALRHAPYVWLVFTALLQAVLVTWGVTYLFEQEFYVRLP